MRYSLLLFFSFCCLHLSAQSFRFPEVDSRIYPISAHLIGDIISGELKMDKLPELTAPYPPGTRSDTLPAGHYLTATLSGETVAYAYFNTYKYEVITTAAGGNFQLRLHDPAGKERAGAVITADGKPVRYSEKHQAYRRRDWRIGELQIVVENDTLFYRVTEGIERSRFAHDLRTIRRTEPFRTLQKPYYYSASIYRAIKDGIGRGYWHWPHTYPLQKTVRRIIRPEAITGYVTTSQPRYRPGDTLRVSAYLAYPKGRPVGKDSLNMLIQRAGRGVRKSFLTKVGGSEKGRYTHLMAIPADWPLDQDYTVSFSYSGWAWRNIAPSITFKLQDYELAEYHLTTKITDDARLPGSAWLDVKAKDINGLALPNGNIKVTVRLDRFVASRDSNTVVLPDTLYTYTEPTDNRKDRRIILPDSIFPTGHSVLVRVETQLTGPSGEYKAAKHALTVDRRYPSIPKLEINGDSLTAFLAPATAPASATATADLMTISPTRDTVISTVTLPLNRPIDHETLTYRLVYGEQSDAVNTRDLSPWEGNFFSWSRDTLRFRLANRHAQTLSWQLRHEDKLLANGDQDTPVFIRTGFPPGHELSFTLRYLAGGEWQYKKQALTAPRYDLRTDHKNVLDLQLTQPEKVIPGETVRVELQATDQKGHPASGVRLTAGTFNARFDKTPVTTPTYQRRQKRRRQRQHYQHENLRLNGNPTPPGWLVKDYELDTAQAYQLRYPDAEFTFRRDLDTLLPDRLQHAHFAPFVIVKHKPVTIRTVYADDRLMYWWHPDITTPYSIPIDSGWHEISLRTDGHRYTKRLYFESCRQLVLSFDAERWVAAGWARMPIDEWTKNEVDRICERVFALSPVTSQNHLHFQDERTMVIQSGKTARGSGWNPLGLATPKRDIQFWFPGGDSVRFEFEPGATYQVTPERDRLYPLSKEVVAIFQKKTAVNGPSAPGLPRYVYRPPVTPQRKFTWESSRLSGISRSEPLSRLQLAGLPERIREVVIVRPRQEKYYQLNLRQPNRLAPGEYDLLFRTKADSVFLQRVILPENKLTLVFYQPDSLTHLVEYNTIPGYSKLRPAREAKVIYEARTMDSNTISGRVIDEDSGESLPFASVFIKESGTGTTTDLNGFFSLNIPDGFFTLTVDYTGYPTVQVSDLPPNAGGRYLTITMAADFELLDEIVVMGYRIPLIEQDNTTTGQTITSGRISNLPTRKVNQIASITAGASSTDEGAAINIRGSRKNTTDYYVDGMRASDADALDTKALPSVNLRSTFSDYAAYLPDLRTDRDGKAVFDITFPDDITAWNTFAVGQDRRRRIGFTLAQTTAFLPLQAQLYLPRFLIEGDRAEAATLAINREDGERAVRLSFSGGNQAARTQDTKLAGSIEQRYPIEAETGTDSMTYAFTLRALDGDQTSDGEQRALPVYPKGTEMVNGELLMLTNKTTALPDAFVRPERGPVTLRLPGNRLHQLLQDLDHIVGYPYACTEQTASRLIGLLQLNDIRKAEGKSFDRIAQIPKMIARLEKLRRPDGGFGWWGSSTSSTPWISLHVYQALALAERAGQLVGDLTPIRRYLLGRAPELPVRDQLQILLTVAEEGSPPTTEEIIRIDTFTTPNDYEFLAVTRLRQLRGDTIDVDSLIARSTRHAALGRYWGRRGYFFFRQPLDGRLACGLLAHRILTTAGETTLAAEASNYMLGQSAAHNRPGNVPLLGTNTLESARLLAELLPTLLAEDGALTSPVVTLQTGGTTTRVIDFPYETVVAADAVAGLHLQRDGSGPLPVAFYQRWFETQPSAKDDGFHLITQLTDARGRPLHQLTLGTTAYLKVTVVSQADAEYVMVEVPIPAGCSYADRNEARGRWAVHREYQRDRVAIFCDRLPTGSHTFRVALAPRFSGTYTLNPARAEMQYLPVVNGNGKLEVVKVR